MCGKEVQIPSNHAQEIGAPMIIRSRCTSQPAKDWVPVELSTLGIRMP